MHPDYADDNDEEFSSFELSEADQDRWHHRQHHSQVRNQAKEPAEKTDEVKEGHVQQAENSNAYGRNQQSDQEVPYDEALQHLLDQPQSDEGGMALMQRKQHYGGRPRMALPGQQKISEERDERRCQHGVGDGPGSVGKDIGPALDLAHRNNIWGFGIGNRLARPTELFSVLLKGLHH